jgi:hypothetical protein
VRRSHSVIRLLLISLLLSPALFSSSASAVGNGEGSRDNRPRTSRVVLVPIDDRPATTQFTQMIGAIADADVVMPPRDALGTFITGGKPERIAEWLRGLDYSRVDAVVLSTDMLAYGGLMTSRTAATSLDTARHRLEVITELRRKNPRLPIYAFNAIQRVALSASAANRSYRDRLARWSVLAEQKDTTGDPKLKSEYEKLQQSIPPAAIKDYLGARARNLEINYLMLELTQKGIVNELLLLQDDAQPFGLHRIDQRRLRERIQALKLSDRQAKLYDGADEGSSVLVSRALLSKYKFSPRINIVYSSEAGRKAAGTFEDQPIETSVERQISGSGAQITSSAAEADYTLYVNAPVQTSEEFHRFLDRLVRDIKAGKRVAIADVYFQNHWGGSDQRLIEALGREHLLDKVIGYASWNTPGNTLGTVVPQANMYVLAVRELRGDKRRVARIEAAQTAFLLHRYIGDYGYHTIVRPEINKYARLTLKIEVEELNQKTYQQINTMVVERMQEVATKIFAEYFKGRSYHLNPGVPGGDPAIVVTQMRNLQVRLPWQRTFEVWVDYTLDYRES